VKIEGHLEGRWRKQHVEKMATCIQKVASEVCRVTKGSGGEAKDTWWWNEEAQRNIKEKKECYKCLYHNRSVDNIE
jgi:ferredoxin-thioredoxin reductase catalytic subunit